MLPRRYLILFRFAVVIANCLRVLRFVWTRGDNGHILWPTTHIWPISELTHDPRDPWPMATSYDHCLSSADVLHQQPTRSYAEPNITARCDCDEQFFKNIIYNSLHTLQQYIPDKNTVNYIIRIRSHNKALIPRTSELNERNFLIRNFYKNCY